MRRTIRLPRFDYAGRATYLVTLVTNGRNPLFGAISAGKMALSAAGAIAFDEWLKVPLLRREVLLDSFVVMPDHFHAIITFRPDRLGIGPGVRARGRGVGAPECGVGAPECGVGAPECGVGAPECGVGAHSRAPLPHHDLRRPVKSLGSLIAQFKASSTVRINALGMSARDAWSCAPKPGGKRSPRVWQRNYYESILWDEGAVHRARAYIDANPRRWDQQRNMG